MKNSNVFTSTIIVIFIAISFSTNAQSGKVDFKAEQIRTTTTYSPKAGVVGIVKTKTYLKFDIRKGEILRFSNKKKYEFGNIEKNNSSNKTVTTEFKPFLKTNKYQLKL